MDAFDWTIVGILLVVVFIIGLISGIFLQDVSEDCYPKVIEKEVVVENDKVNLKNCIDLVKNADLFEKELFEKEWLSE